MTMKWLHMSWISALPPQGASEWQRPGHRDAVAWHRSTSCTARSANVPDVFFGRVILFEMLGRRAFVGDSLNAVMQRIAEQDIVVPEDAGIDERPGTILLKATARDPALRFATWPARSNTGAG